MKKNFSEDVIQAFLLNSRTKDIAEASGLSTKTVSRYKKDPELQKILDERRLEYVKGAVSKLQTVMGECVDKLMEIIRNDETAPQVKVNAIQTVFNQCREWTATTEILERLEAIEEAQKGSY